MAFKLNSGDMMRLQLAQLKTPARFDAAECNNRRARRAAAKMARKAAKAVA